MSTTQPVAHEDLRDLPRTPEFDSYGLDVLDFAVAFGAAKVGGIVTAFMLDTLNADRSWEHWLQNPDLAAIFNPLEPVPQLKKRKIMHLEFGRDPRDPEDLGVRPHQDEVARVGLTFLIPTEGDPATFGASNRRFHWEKNPPPLVWDYGVTDMIVLAQALYRFNGRLVRRRQAWHTGLGSDVRDLTVVDLEARSFNTNFPNQQ